MAREEVLTRFLNANIDPALLVDLSLQLERDAVDLTEISLLELVDSKRMLSEVKRSAERLQRAFQEIIPEEIFPEMNADHLIECRMRSIRARIDFFNPFLVCEKEVDSPLELAAKAFVDIERFQKRKNAVISADRLFSEEFSKQANQMQRLMIKRHGEHEIKSLQMVWDDFEQEAFKKPRLLS